MRILIVDDEERYAKVLQQVLNQEGFTDVETATDADSALEKFSNQPSDLLITDLRMPGESGLELMERLKLAAPGLDVILMTAYADVETARRALKHGALDYLVKPFDTSELVELVRQSYSRRTEHAAPPASADTDAASIPKKDTELDWRSNERQLIEEALERSGGKKTKAARLLGISRRRLYSRMQRLGMDDTE
jgi:DNA-binding NtrC family response regulator